MEYVWEIIEPWIAAIGGAGGLGAVLYFIVRRVVNKILDKNNTLLDKSFNIDSLSIKVAEKLAGKTLNIDVTAITEKALEKMARKQDAQTEKTEAAINSLKRILIPIGKGVIKLKALTSDEVNELASAIKTLESEYKPPAENEIVTVLLEPVKLEGKDVKEEAAPSGGVNFDGLENK